MTSLAFVSNLAGFDGLLIFMVLLLLFGAKKLPELARGLGSAVREFSKAKDEIQHEMTRPPTQPMTPQIEAPKYTEPHVTASADPHAFSTVGEAKPPIVVHDSPVVAQPGVFGSAEVPVSAPVTEEHQHRPTAHTV